MTRQPGHNSSSSGVFVVIKVTAGKSYNCNSESEPDTPCKLIPENADVLTKSSAPLSLPRGCAVNLGYKWQDKSPLNPSPYTHTNTPSLFLASAAQREFSLLQHVTIIHSDNKQLAMLHITHDP